MANLRYEFQATGLKFLNMFARVGFFFVFYLISDRKLTTIEQKTKILSKQIFPISNTRR